ncbi:(Fe-S)-binding protein [Pseudonocardia acidicola]|uniref:4Fe-4S domain-containing protein n=1 Tax=Pseudonocardia acidicola TaxID=2724939 RepID=A0ABX1SP13_9PSEU|nr:(Fe-S)-binding protein [Pseudonocardia acidicola]NMI02050.1 hypothetical protein [Pseudonocardia acidicola]
MSITIQRIAETFQRAAGGTGPRVTEVDPRAVEGPLCRCGHGPQAHDHYRPGSDCGICGAASCRRFVASGARTRRRSWWRKGSSA